MKIEVVNAPLAEQRADAYLLAFAVGAREPGPWAALDEASGGLLAEALASGTFTGKTGASTGLLTRGALPCRDLVLAGLGDADDVDLEAFRNAIAAGVRTARSRGARSLTIGIAPGEDAASRAAAAAEAAVLGAYRYSEYKKPAETDGAIESLQICVPGEVDADAGVQRATAIAEAACWARDLINTPPSEKRPPDLAQRAAAMAAEFGLDCTILDEKDAEQAGMAALLAVGRGSAAPPRLVVLEHAPEGVDGPPLLLVGKGVTFDTGGISIKPAKDMDHMKGDMGGAAAVLGAMRAVAAVGLPIRVVGVTPMAENMPGGNAYKPGDLIRACNGKTIEVLNTDAEGRLILADALAWASERFEPACVVDLATLTGACVVALGERVAGLMSNEDGIAAELEQAGQRTGERVWRLPMFAEYRQLIDSPVADVKNTGGRWAGAITAAKFLEEFVDGERPWAHLDIAGPAYATAASGYRPQGGVGFGVRLLLEWATARAGDAS